VNINQKDMFVSHHLQTTSGSYM